LHFFKLFDIFFTVLVLKKARRLDRLTAYLPLHHPFIFLFACLPAPGALARLTYPASQRRSRLLASSCLTPASPCLTVPRLAAPGLVNQPDFPS
jgi:hypothetical protein